MNEHQADGRRPGVGDETERRLRESGRLARQLGDGAAPPTDDAIHADLAHRRARRRRRQLQGAASVAAACVAVAVGASLLRSPTVAGPPGDEVAGPATTTTTTTTTTTVAPTPPTSTDPGCPPSPPGAPPVPCAAVGVAQSIVVVAPGGGPAPGLLVEVSGASADEPVPVGVTDAEGRLEPMDGLPLVGPLTFVARGTIASEDDPTCRYEVRGEATVDELETLDEVTVDVEAADTPTACT